MATITEIITVTVTGANAVTQNYSVQVNTDTGASANPLSIPLSGANPGLSTIVATMPSHNLSSNSAQIAWQATNGQIALTTSGQVWAFSNSSSTRGWPGSFISPDTVTPGINSLVLNQPVANYPISGFTGTKNASPMISVFQTPSGTYSSSIQIPTANAPPFVLDFREFNFIVATAGTYTFYVAYANVSSFAMYIGGGATFSSQSVNGGNTGNPFPATGPWGGYPLAIVSTNMGASSNPNVVSSYITFPEAGVYPFEIVYNQYLAAGGSNNSYFQVTYLSGLQNQNVGQTPQGGTFLPVALIQTPQGQTPNGDLQLNPPASLIIGGQTDNLVLTVQNVSYTSISYAPILEGTPGSLKVSNSLTGFNFQTYNGNTVNPTAAISSGVFSIIGNNLSGLLSITPSGNYFSLNYNGGTFSFITPGAQIAASQLTYLAEDIAWYDGTNNSFDLFTYPNNLYSTLYTLEIDFMTRPTVSSVSPSTLSANGTTQAITINLSKPMSPQQQGLYDTGNTVSATATVTGGATLASLLAPILDNLSYLRGWSTSITVPNSSTNGSITLNLSVTGNLTYLNGSSFVTNTVTYISGPVATIQTTGSNYVAPTVTNLTVTNPATTGLLSSTETLTATVYTFDNNPLTCMFYQIGTAMGSTSVSLGSSSTSINSYTGTVGGKTVYYKTYAINATFNPTINGEQVNLGVVVTDSVSALSVTYQSTTNYQIPSSGGGGGGGGCPAVEMFIDDWHQVSDVFEGMALNTLVGETPEYAGGITPNTEIRQVQWFKFGTEICYRLKTANGAEVIVSSSTPVPTLESIEAYAKDLPSVSYAHEMQVGMHVITEIDLLSNSDRIEWSPLVEVECVGIRQVCRIYCGGRNFAAGSKPGMYIYTHNNKVTPPK